MVERVRTTPRTAQDFAAQIRTSWQKAVESIIETGKLLISAKKALGHGKWMTMFEGPNKLPFGDRTAQILMEIAKHPILSNPKFISVLPASWGTLHKLADLPEEALKTILADGTITADTTSKDVDEIRKKIRGDGVYIWNNLREGLDTLIKFQARWPDPTEIANHVVEDYWEEVPLNKLAVLPQWISTLCAACKRLEEEWERRSKQLDEKLERQQRELDTEDEPVGKARGANKRPSLLSFAERQRRSFASARMRLRNGSEFPLEE